MVQDGRSNNRHGRNALRGRITSRTATKQHRAPRVGIRFVKVPDRERCRTAAWRDHPKIEDPARRFIWVANRHRNRRFPYLCSGCGETLGINQRVALSKRKCPGCGSPITIESIDLQSDRLEDQMTQTMSWAQVLLILGIVLIGVAVSATKCSH